MRLATVAPVGVPYQGFSASWVAAGRAGGVLGALLALLVYLQLRATGNVPFGQCGRSPPHWCYWPVDGGAGARARPTPPPADTTIPPALPFPGSALGAPANSGQ